MYIANRTIALDKVKNTVKMIAGIVIALFFGMAFFGAFLEFDPADIPLIIFMAILMACGVCMVISGVKGKRLANLATRCGAVLGDAQSYSISQLATDLNMPKATLRTALEKMFTRRYFPSARFDNTGDKIYFGQQITRSGANYGSSDIVTMICASCGGVNHVSRRKGCACEYCGSPLSTK